MQLRIVLLFNLITFFLHTFMNEIIRRLEYCSEHAFNCIDFDYIYKLYKKTFLKIIKFTSLF